MSVSDARHIIRLGGQLFRPVEPNSPRTLNLSTAALDLDFVKKR
jgi:hypothetical protein